MIWKHGSLHRAIKKLRFDLETMCKWNPGRGVGRELPSKGGYRCVASPVSALRKNYTCPVYHLFFRTLLSIQIIFALDICEQDIFSWHIAWNMLPGYNFKVKYIKTSIICPVFRPLFHTLYGRLPSIQVLFFHQYLLALPNPGFWPHHICTQPLCYRESSVSPQGRSQGNYTVA